MFSVKSRKFSFWVLILHHLSIQVNSVLRLDSVLLPNTSLTATDWKYSVFGVSLHVVSGSPWCSRVFHRGQIQRLFVHKDHKFVFVLDHLMCLRKLWDYAIKLRHPQRAKALLQNSALNRTVWNQVQESAEAYQRFSTS